MVIVPPGGFAGFSQMTPASKASLFRGGPARSSGRRRRTKGTKRKRGVLAKKRGGRKTRMKFGSPAWQKKYKVGKFAKKR
jgi:hypothetical protein